MNLDWDQIRVFLAVARAGQILAAAKILKLDHATVSRRLNAFEAQLKSHLFERSPAGCQLTAAGRQLLPIAERVEADVFSMEAAITQSDLELTGTVKIGVADGLGTYMLAPMMGELVHENPGLNLQLLPLPMDFSVSKREVDIAITLQQPSDERLICQRLVNYRLSLVGTNNYMARNGVPRDLRDLRHHIAVTPILHQTYPTIDFFQEIAKNSKMAYECASVSAQLEAVLAGVGIGVMPHYLTNKFSELHIILPDVSYSRTYWLVSHPDGRDVARIAVVRRFIFEVIRKHKHIFTTQN